MESFHIGDLVRLNKHWKKEYPSVSRKYALVVSNPYKVEKEYPIYIHETNEIKKATFIYVEVKWIGSVPKNISYIFEKNSVNISLLEKISNASNL